MNSSVLLALLVLACTFLSADALQCYVGRASLRRSVNREKDVTPVLSKCNPDAKCCKAEMALTGAIWSCASDCPPGGEKCGFEENHSWCWCLSHSSPQCNARYAKN
ncbi:hypothetical protein PFISCL1PPCAC_12734 [Pristionchus fissidentatus]|uniref:Uncharacterized protein n=1 Tax=Pristionchus fissidentatus TaxID=1538716 RepID=A0AAV5VRV4_9BILA|nr:hypothetical protein PFISCL1PPCAC_12734 [Pristionchus fissidentatus]